MRDLTSSDSGSPSRVATTQLQHPAATPGEERRGREEELEPHQATICRPARPRWVWSVNAWQTIRYKKLEQHFFKKKIGDQKKHPEPEVSEEEREAGGSGGPGLSPLRSDGGGNPSPLRGGRRSLPAGSSSPCALTSDGLVVLLILLGFPLVRT